jgi:phosphatidylserine decarboxylase
VIFLGFGLDMTKRTISTRLFSEGSLNFILTNGFPRRTATRFAGWFCRVRQPLVRDLSIAVWRRFCDVDLADAKKARFDSLHDCFVRELRDGARPVDPSPRTVVSPCDAITGSCGTIRGDELLQVKGSPYTLNELLRDESTTADLKGGIYATLRLTAGMYHRFHAPHDVRVESVRHVPGGVWNVNPPTLERIDRVFCRNERAVIRLRIEPSGQLIVLVAVAAVLVAGIRLRLGDAVVDPRQLGNGPVPSTNFSKGDEMGWFEHGSTIIVLAPAGFTLAPGVQAGIRQRAGHPLFLQTPASL